MTTTRETILRPGLFGDGVAADSRRFEFDYGNESLVLAGVRPDAVFIGDSITHLWELQAYFGGTGKILVNRGIGGDVSTYMRKRFAADVLQLHPALTVMKIGTNDLGWEPAQLNPALTEIVCDNITDMTIMAQKSGIRAAVCSLLPIWDSAGSTEATFAPRKNSQINDINARLQAMTAETGAIYVDYHSEMLAPDGSLRRELAEDGVHPHSAGYTIMARVLRETLAGQGITI